MDENQQSHFNERSDNAALKLKQEIGAQQGREIPSTQVQVGPDGRPAAPLPPEGSYARMASEQQQRAEQGMAAQQAAALQGQPTQQQQLGNQPPAGTPEQASDGSIAPPMTPPAGQAAAPAEPAQQNSANAERRIRQLIEQQHTKDREIAELRSRDSESDQLRTQVAQLTQERQQFLEQNLEALDPETRAQVIASSQFKQMMEENNRQLLDRIMPQLSSVQQQNEHREFHDLAERYPAFDLQIHKELIDIFRGKYPECPLEMAWKAIAEPGELVTREQASAQAVPPVVAAGNGSAPMRSMIPTPQADPVEQMRDDQRRAYELRRSADPNDQKMGLRAIDQLLSQRIQGASYKDKPGVF